MTEQPAVPHFSVTTIDGRRSAYRDVWQRKNLLLIVIPRTESVERTAWLAAIQAHMTDLTAHETECVITSDRIDGIPCPAVVIADRWGEIAFVADAKSGSDLPDAEALIDWLRHVQGRCPECEGEAR
jgi:hypothetical protein